MRCWCFCNVEKTRAKQKDNADPELHRVDIELSGERHSHNSLPAHLISDFDDDADAKESHRGSILAPTVSRQFLLILIMFLSAFNATSVV